METQAIGRVLRVERERQRLSLESVARATKVRQDYLELIDTERLDELPAGAYAKGFIRAYAAFLGLDPAPFLQAYEARHGRPEPELSAVVRRPVRVPNAAQPRAWRAAAGIAIGLLLVLGLLGAFGSGEESTPPPEVAADVAESMDSPAPNPLGAVVKVEVVGERSWVQAEADGELIFQGTLTTGEERTFRGEDRVYLVFGNAGAVRLYANGQDVGIPDDPTYRGAFTPDTTELPPSQPSTSGT